MSSAGAGYAQKEKEIIAKFRAALHGSADYEYDQPVTTRGKITMGAVAMEGVMYYHRPNHRMELSFGNVSFITVQSDSLIWSYNGVDNSHHLRPVIKEDKEAEMRLNWKLDFSSKDLLMYKERGHTLKNLGIKKVDSVETHAMQLTLKDKTVVDFYISTRTNLVYKVQSGNDSRVYANYRMYGDHIYPDYISMPYNGSTFEMITSEVSFEPIPASRFTIPQEAFDAKKKKDARLEASLIHADSLYGIREYRKAKDEYSAIIREHGKIYRAYNGRGLCEFEEQKYYDAIKDFDDALALVPTGKVALSNRGLAKYNIGDTQGALVDFSAATAADSTYAPPFANRGQLFINQEKYNEAVAELAKAVRLRPSHPDYHYRYGIALAQIESYDQAIRAYRQSMLLGLNSASVHNYLGVVYYKTEKYDSAASEFKSAIDLDKTTLVYIKNYGDALYAVEEYDDAIAQYEHYNSIKNDDAEVHNMIGLCKYRQEDFKGSIKKFSRSIELQPASSIYFNNRASAKEQIEDYEGAISDYSQSISIFPNNADVFLKRGLIKILTSKKIEGCMDLGTAHEMKHEGAREAILTHCSN